MRAMKFHFKALSGLFALIVCAAGCGGGSGGGVGGGGGSELPIAVRSAAIAKVEGEAERLETLSLTPAQENAQLATFIRALPEFSDANTTPDLCVWGKFTDGRFLVVANNRDPVWQQNRPASPTPVRQRKPGDVLTASKQARLFHSFGTGFDQQQGLISQMKPWLQQAGYTIVPTQEGDARLATLRTVAGDGFFYFNTHGGSFDLSQTEKVFCAQSSTLKSDDNERLPEIKGDLDAKRIVYMTAKNGGTIKIGPLDIADWDTRYAITYKFVESYWSFGANAIVFMNACYSGITTVGNGAQAFMFACFQKGAGAYLGWSAVVQSPTSENAPRYFVDRMTAANVVDKETPDQRAFFTSDIVADMKRQGVVPGANGTDLVLRLKTVNDVGLRPSIKRLQMAEMSDTLFLEGKFGSTPGKVTVDGRDATILDWNSDLILARIPKSGPGSYGDVVVDVSGRTSNKRQLTKWVTNFAFTQTGQGTLKCVINAKLIIRQDFAKFREQAGSALKLTDPIPVFVSPESTCTFTASGEHRDSLGKLVESWSGSGACTWSVVVPQTPNGKFTSNGAYDPVANEFALGIICGGKRVIGGDNPAEVMAGGGAMIRKPQLPSWVIPAYNEPPGSVTFSFSQANPLFPPASDLQYRPN